MTNLFGQNLINCPAPIGYGVTNMPVHLPTYWSLGDRYYTTNFGMATQHNIYNAGYDPKIYHLAQNAGAYAAFDPMLTSLIGSPSSFPFPGVTPGLSTYPPIGFGGTSTPSSTGTTAGNIHMNSVKTVYLPKLKALVTDLETAMCEDGLSEKHQLMLQKQIDKANELIARIETACANKETTMEEATALQNEVSTFQNQAGAIVSRINADIAKQKEAELEEQAKKDTEMSEKATEQIEEKTKNLTNESADICSTLYRELQAGCSDSDKVEGTIAKINKDNVVTVLSTWNAQYKDGKTGGNLIEEILDDDQVFDGDSFYDDVENIVNALKERAIELDLYTSLQGEFSVIYEELDDGDCFFGNCNEAVVAEAVDKIIEKMAEPDAVDISEKISKDIQDQVDANKKAETASKKSEVEASKKKALARALKSHFKLENDVNLSGNVQILFDDNGKFKAYKVEIEGISFEEANAMKLVTDIEACGFDAKKLFYSGSVA